MPILLEDIATGATEEETLTSDERNWIREILGISDISTDRNHILSERRFNALSAFKNKSIRFWMRKYESLGDKMMSINAEGANISKAEDRKRVALALYNAIFATKTVTPLDNINVSTHEESRSRWSSIRVQHHDDDEQFKKVETPSADDNTWEKIEW